MGCAMTQRTDKKKPTGSTNPPAGRTDAAIVPRGIRSIKKAGHQAEVSDLALVPTKTEPRVDSRLLAKQLGDKGRSFLPFQGGEETNHDPVKNEPSNKQGDTSGRSSKCGVTNSFSICGTTVGLRCRLVPYHRTWINRLALVAQACLQFFIRHCCVVRRLRFVLNNWWGTPAVSVHPNIACYTHHGQQGKNDVEAFQAFQDVHPLECNAMLFIAAWFSRRYTAPKPRGPVLNTPKPVAFASPSEKRAFVLPRISRSRITGIGMVSGGMGHTARLAARLQACVQHPAHLMPLNRQMVDSPGSPVGTQTMTATPVASASARTPTTNALNFEAVKTTSEAQAFALLQATSDATMAKLYLSKGNIPAARRKAVQLLKALQSLEVTA